MTRRFLCGAIFWACSSHVLAIDIWLSNSLSPSAPPTTTSAVPTFQNFTSQSAALYVWARPDTAKTLDRWSLRLTSTNSNVLNFDPASIEAYNLLDAQAAGTEDDEVRWEYTYAPAGNASRVDLFGFNVGSVGTENPLRIAEGIGKSDNSCNANDAFCGMGSDNRNSWLLAKINYTLGASPGQTDLFFQIGSVGMSQEGETSGQTLVRFGHTGETALNAGNDRLVSSSFRDARIQLIAAPDADLNNDGFVEGLDLGILLGSWEKNVPPSAGELNGILPVDGLDLGILLGAWSPPPLSAVQSVPELQSGVLLLVAIACSSGGVRRVRRNCGYFTPT